MYGQQKQIHIYSSRFSSAAVRADDMNGKHSRRDQALCTRVSVRFKLVVYWKVDLSLY